MNVKKVITHIIILTLALWLIIGCGGMSTEPTAAPVATATSVAPIPTELPPTEVPPTEVPTVESSTAEPPPIVALPDGTRCAFAGTGATLAFDGKRLNYTCEVEGQEVGLLGDLQPQGDGTWAAEKVVLGHNDDGFFVQESEIVTVTAVDEDSGVGMANPASVFCEEQGGAVDIRKEAGGEVGYCVFPDGSECEEWDFYRGECSAVSSIVCNDLMDDMAQTLGVDVMMTAQLPFQDYIYDNMSIGCQLTAAGTGQDFENVDMLFTDVATLLQDRGWQEDIEYAAGGPAGSLAGYRLANDLCLLQVDWQPTEDADCPADQPISACELSPEQRLYSIMLDCADTSTSAEVESADVDTSDVSEVLPLDTPLGFEFLYGLADSLMLPSEFPVEAGAPAVVPHVITAEPGEYEISLDYGPDCHGAGACHYGSLAGKWVTSTQPESTRTITFEADRAQPVLLANDIEGYFIEAQCGASCDDAKLFWIYNGFQYMIGLKGGSQADVVALANAAITNSLWTSSAAMPDTSDLAIEAFVIEAEDNADGGKNLILTWQTTGAAAVEIWLGPPDAASMWEVEPNGSFIIEYSADQAYESQNFTLNAFDVQGNFVSESNAFYFSCQHTLFFDSGQCVDNEAQYAIAAEQLFEYGRMLWFNDGPYANSVLVIYDDGVWERFNDTWQPGEPESDPAMVPPNGLYQPVRGFGKVWRESPVQQERLGWALAEEQGFEAIWQQDVLPAKGSPPLIYVLTGDGQIIKLIGREGGNWGQV